MVLSQGTTILLHDSSLNNLARRADQVRRGVAAAWLLPGRELPGHVRRRGRRRRAGRRARRWCAYDVPGGHGRLRGCPLGSPARSRSWSSEVGPGRTTRRYFHVEAPRWRTAAAPRTTSCSPTSTGSMQSLAGGAGRRARHRTDRGGIDVSAASIRSRLGALRRRVLGHRHRTRGAGAPGPPGPCPARHHRGAAAGAGRRAATRHRPGRGAGRAAAPGRRARAAPARAAGPVVLHRRHPASPAAPARRAGRVARAARDEHRGAVAAHRVRPARGALRAALQRCASAPAAPAVRRPRGPHRRRRPGRRGHRRGRAAAEPRLRPPAHGRTTSTSTCASCPGSTSWRRSTSCPSTTAPSRRSTAPTCSSTSPRRTCSGACCRTGATSSRPVACSARRCPTASSMLDGHARGEIPFEDLRAVLYGGQEYEGDFHFTMFGAETLSALLGRRRASPTSRSRPRAAATTSASSCRSRPAGPGESDVRRHQHRVRRCGLGRHQHARPGATRSSCCSTR